MISPNIVSELIEEKINLNENILVFSYFYLRVEKNFTETEIYEFLTLAKNKLSNMGYDVYFKGETYSFENQVKKVKDNERMVAIRVLSRRRKTK